MPSEPRSYQCTKCDKKYTLPGNLKRHVLEKHDKTKKRCRHHCKICLKPCPTIVKLRDHLQKQHKNEGGIGRGVEYVCDICLKVFKYRNNIVGHLRYAHDQGITTRVLFTCQFCKRKFNRKFNLEYHIQHSACSRNPNPDTRLRIICYKCGASTLERNIKLHLNRYCTGVSLALRNTLNSVNEKRKEERTNHRSEIRKQIESHTENIKKTVTVRELRLQSKTEVSEINEEREQSKVSVGFQVEASTSRRHLRKRKKVDYKSLNDPYADEIRTLWESSRKEATTPRNSSEPQIINKTDMMTLSDVKPYVNIEDLDEDLKVEPDGESDNLVKENAQSIFEVDYVGLSRREDILQSIKQEAEVDKDFDGDWCVPRQDEIVMKTDVEDCVLQDTTSVYW